MAETLAVLLADDDASIRSSLSRALRLSGYALTCVSDGQQALDVLSQGSFDVAILDVSMPHLSGVEVTRMLRERGEGIPVLLLTARAEISDRVQGLDAGADDYVVKPFDLEELQARVRALLRRAEPSDAHRTSFEALGVAVDTSARTATRDGVELSLTRIEFDLLTALVNNAGVVMSSTTLYMQVWGYDFGRSSKNLPVYVTYLRKKLEAAGGSRLIHSVRGVGFVFREDV